MHLVNLSLFFKFNFFLTSLIFLLFLQNSVEYSAYELFVLSLACISTSATVYLLLYIVFLIISPLKKMTIYLSALVFISLNLGLVIDFFIFRLYKFHINAMVLNIITSPDALESMDIGMMPIVVLFMSVCLFIYFEFSIIKKLMKQSLIKQKAFNKRLNKMIILPLFIVLLSEKFIYGFSSLFGKYELVSKFNVVPLYQRLTFGRIAAKYFDYKPEEIVSNSVTVSNSLSYPLKPIEFKNNLNKFNILIVASDALRNSILDAQTTPNIEAFKKDSLVFDNHYSGGNATRFGIFSLIYGVNSTYWFSFLNRSQGPVLFDVLKDLDYDIDIVSSTSTNWPEFRKTCYADIQESIKDDFEGKPWEKDKQNTAYTLECLNNYTNEKPFFLFSFFDAPHGYSFPAEHNVFYVEKENINYITATKGSKEIQSAKLRYKNAAHYNDKLFGDMIQRLKEKGLYDSTMIIFTSDHGQEFYEYGAFGHNSSFSKAQTNSPLIIKLPKGLSYTTDANVLTSHNDIVATILSLIGVKNDTRDYSNGFNLFDKDFKRKYSLSSNWNNNAIITKDKTYLFSNLPNKVFENEIRNTQTYEKISDAKVDNKMLLDIINENRKFLK